MCDEKHLCSIVLNPLVGGGRIRVNSGKASSHKTKQLFDHRLLSHDKNMRLGAHECSDVRVDAAMREEKMRPRTRPADNADGCDSETAQSD